MPKHTKIRDNKPPNLPCPAQNIGSLLGKVCLRAYVTSNYGPMRISRFFLCGSMLLLSACFSEEEMPSLAGAKAPEDRGIYVADSSRSEAFCDFRLLSDPAACWAPALTVYEDCHYNLLFTRYGNGWTGADATYSIALPEGRILWLFGDTFLGKVNADRSRSNAPFVRNTAVMQVGDELTTYYQGPADNPSAFVSPANPNEWYWPLDGTVHNGQLQLMLGRLGSTGTGGMWDFGYVGFDLAIYSLPDLQLLSLTHVIDDPEISYGSCVLEDENHLYIYGISTQFLSKKAHIARVANGDLTGTWEFYNGSAWVSQASNYAIADGVSDQFSVISDGEKYYLITHEIIFGEEIFIMESNSPTGPWTNKRTLYCTPEAGGNIFTYNAFAHPELAENGELRISYNINSFEFADLFENADLYRPRFIRVDNWR